MSLYDTFVTEVKDKIFKPEPIKTDNFVFKLHYVWTVALLISFSVLLSLSQVKICFHKI